MKVSVVFWTQSGNTEAMANMVAEGAKGAGADVEVLNVSAADEGVMDSDVVFFGCPAMGNEELDDSEFEPFFASVEGKLSGKKVGLFGSYGWGSGEWMDSWKERAEGDGAVVIGTVIANYEPDSDAEEACKALGAKAAN